MKTSLLTPLATVLLAAPTLALGASDASEKAAPGSFQERLTAALDDLDARVDDGAPTGPSVDELSKIVGSLPSTSSLRARMTFHLEDFATRAARTFVGRQDVAVLRTGFVLGQIDGYLDDLDRRAAGGGWSAKDYAEVLEDWIARGRTFVDAPDPSMYRARFLEGVAEARSNAKSWAGASQHVREFVTDQRLRWARRVFAARRAEGSATPLDTTRLIDAIYAFRSVRAQKLSGHVG